MKFLVSVPSSFRHYLVWYGAGVVVAFLFSLFQNGPGYMDSAYYTVGGLQLYEGKGFYEPYIWNYLVEPKGIPAPAFLYWMPLPSLLVFSGMFAGQSASFFWAKIPFIFVAGLLPALTVFLAKKWLINPKFAWIAGGLALFPGLYSIYLSIPESFTIYMVGGALFLILGFVADHQNLNKWEGLPRYLILGVTAGYMHLARADGLLYLIAAIGIGTLKLPTRREIGNKIRIAIMRIGAVIAGYALIMGWWYYRNWMEFGTLFPPGNGKTIWLTTYNQLYSFPSDHLTFSQWLKEGFASLLDARWNAFKLNIQNFLGVQASVVLFPLILIGCWWNKNKLEVKFSILMWGSIFLLMTFVFPFAGSRGGFLHSGAAIQLFFWAIAAAGLERIVLRMKELRNWKIFPAMSVFGAFLIIVNLSIALWFYYYRVIGDTGNPPVWNQSLEQYEKIGLRLKELGVDQQEIGMVNNPPGYYWATRLPGIAIPDGDLSHTLMAAKKFGASYLLLEANQENLLDLFHNPQSMDGMRYIETFENTHIFFIK